MTLRVRPFTPADRDPYAAWFADPLLDARLGPPWSDEEFAQVLADPHGQE